ncbi:cupin domain-containing protein [Amycolatopsis sp. GM8]|uniref:cupin domain-containing protein n=1 Tax=Amycolatopsis sp. GM8 TaxID=2896530 RepID=UPI001F23F1D9|nr:cupin domain-containing protein [Amycolatopsis sp. GM8]
MSVSGRGTFHLDGKEFEARPGMFLCFEKKKVHGFPRIDEHPLVMLAIDVPRPRP